MPHKKTNETSNNSSLKKSKDSTWVYNKNINLSTKNPSIKDNNTKDHSFFERWENSRFLLIKGLYYLFRSVWIIVMAIGSFIAWLIAVLFI